MRECMMQYVPSLVRLLTLRYAGNLRLRHGGVASVARMQDVGERLSFLSLPSLCL